MGHGDSGEDSHVVNENICKNMDACTWILLVVYGCTWMSLVFPNILPLARPTTSMGGAMTAIGIKFFFGSKQEHAGFIDLDVVAILFGIMLVVYFVGETGFFGWIEKTLTSRYGWGILIKITLMSGFLSAVFMNDSIAIVFAPIVVNMCEKLSLDYFPYLLALATACNIGSALAPSGNPQNAMILNYAGSSLNFMRFVRDQAVPSILGLGLNIAFMLLLYKREFMKVIDEPQMRNHTEVLISTEEEIYEEGKEKEDFELSVNMSEIESRTRFSYLQQNFSRQWSAILTDDAPGFNKKDKLFSALVMVITLIMVVLFLVGIDQGAICIAVGMVFLVYSGIKKGKDAHNGERRDDHTEEVFISQIDYPLLLLFVGQFILVSIVQNTGVPDVFFKGMLGGCLEGTALVESRCVYWFGFVVLILSNILSNVPLMILLKPVINGIEDQDIRGKAWIIVAWSATIAGNFTILGSAANLIVAAGAARKGVHCFTAKRHAVFGIPSTLVIMYIGILFFNLIY